MEDAFSIWMQTFGLVFIAELGDKSQLLLLTLVVQFQRPIATLIGLIIGTLISQSLAVVLAHSMKEWISVELLQLASGLVFLAVAIVLLISVLRDSESHELKPSQRNESEERRTFLRVVVSTIAALVLAEFGDKTQFVATGSALHHALGWPVVLGASSAMVTANLIPIFFGAQLMQRVSARAIQWLAITVFAAIGIRYLVLFRSEARQLFEFVAP